MYIYTNSRLDSPSPANHVIRPKTTRLVTSLREELAYSLLTACLESGTVCKPCSDLGHQSVHTPIRACQSCLKSGSKCVKLLVLLWTADCDENNKQAMEQIIKLSNDETDHHIKEQMKFSKPIPEAVHLGKCLKSSFANWFLFLNGERFNLSNIRVLYNDEDDHIRRRMR